MISNMMMIGMAVDTPATAADGMKQLKEDSQIMPS
jgi:hypothetical protein